MGNTHSTRVVTTEIAATAVAPVLIIGAIFCRRPCVKSREKRKGWETAVVRGRVQRFKRLVR